MVSCGGHKLLLHAAIGLASAVSITVPASAPGAPTPSARFFTKLIVHEDVVAPGCSRVPFLDNKYSLSCSSFLTATAATLVVTDVLGMPTGTIAPSATLGQSYFPVNTEPAMSSQTVTVHGTVSIPPASHQTAVAPFVFHLDDELRGLLQGLAAEACSGMALNDKRQTGDGTCFDNAPFLESQTKQPIMWTFQMDVVSKLASSLYQVEQAAGQYLRPGITNANIRWVIAVIGSIGVIGTLENTGAVTSYFQVSAAKVNDALDRLARMFGGPPPSTTTSVCAACTGTSCPLVSPDDDQGQDGDRPPPLPRAPPQVPMVPSKRMAPCGFYLNLANENCQVCACSDMGRTTELFPISWGAFEATIKDGIATATTTISDFCAGYTTHPPSSLLVTTCGGELSTITPLPATLRSCIPYTNPNMNDCFGCECFSTKGPETITSGTFKTSQSVYIYVTTGANQIATAITTTDICFGHTLYPQSNHVLTCAGHRYPTLAAPPGYPSQKACLPYIKDSAHGCRGCICDLSIDTTSTTSALYPYRTSKFVWWLTDTTQSSSSLVFSTDSCLGYGMTAHSTVPTILCLPPPSNTPNPTASPEPEPHCLLRSAYPEELRSGYPEQYCSCVDAAYRTSASWRTTWAAVGTVTILDVCPWEKGLSRTPPAPSSLLITPTAPPQ